MCFTRTTFAQRVKKRAQCLDVVQRVRMGAQRVRMNAQRVRMNAQRLRVSSQRTN